MGPATMRIHLVSLASAALLFLAACSATVPDATPPDSARSATHAGRQIYHRSCSSCHGPHAPSSHTDLEWQRIVPDMAREAKLSPDDERLLLAWLLEVN